MEKVYALPMMETRTPLVSIGDPDDYVDDGGLERGHRLRLLCDFEAVLRLVEKGVLVRFGVDAAVQDLDQHWHEALDFVELRREAEAEELRVESNDLRRQLVALSLVNKDGARVKLRHEFVAHLPQ